MNKWIYVNIIFVMRNLQIPKLLKIQCLFTLSFHSTVACGRASITFGYLFLSKPLLNLIWDNLTCIVYRSKGVKQRCLPGSHWRALCIWNVLFGCWVVGAAATEAAVLTLALCLVAANLHSLITTCPHEWSFMWLELVAVFVFVRLARSV